MNRKENQSPQKETSRLLVEFLEVAITSIIFLRNIPHGTFERQQYMNLVIHKARHPQLHYYIHNSLNALVPYIQQGMVERIAVIFFNNDKIPIEKFIFKININQSHGIMIEDADLESPLRSFLTKLSLSEPLSKTVISRLEVGNNSILLLSAQPRMQIRQTWIPTCTHQWQQPPLITPIKSMNIDPLSVQLYLEHPNLMNPSLTTCTRKIFYKQGKCLLMQ